MKLHSVCGRSFRNLVLAKMTPSGCCNKSRLEKRIIKSRSRSKSPASSKLNSSTLKIQQKNATRKLCTSVRLKLPVFSSPRSCRSSRSPSPKQFSKVIDETSQQAFNHLLKGSSRKRPHQSFSDNFKKYNLWPFLKEGRIDIVDDMCASEAKKPLLDKTLDSAVVAQKDSDPEKPFQLNSFLATNGTTVSEQVSNCSTSAFTTVTTSVTPSLGVSHAASSAPMPFCFGSAAVSLSLSSTSASIVPFTTSTTIFSSPIISTNFNFTNSQFPTSGFRFGASTSLPNSTTASNSTLTPNAGCNTGANPTIGTIQNPVFTFGGPLFSASKVSTPSRRRRR
ncbi:Chemotaxis protein CheA [Trichinella spiralis]|uniref:Chemotaxis protein CheA n=1 Tax=Trichinella spiralis TaxID=6334 RepID=A0ABR3K7Q4_TRISP